MRGEANLRGHLKIEGADEATEASEEEFGSSFYVAPKKDKDTQLKYALDLLRASKTIRARLEGALQSIPLSPIAIRRDEVDSATAGRPRRARCPPKGEHTLKGPAQTQVQRT